MIKINEDARGLLLGLGILSMFIGNYYYLTKPTNTLILFVLGLAFCTLSGHKRWIE